VICSGNGRACWIGLNRGQWLDGSNSTYRNWQQGSTNTLADCVSITHSGQFVGSTCSDEKCFICEMTPVVIVQRITGNNNVKLYCTYRLHVLQIIYYKSLEQKMLLVSRNFSERGCHTILFGELDSMLLIIYVFRHEHVNI